MLQLDNAIAARVGWIEIPDPKPNERNEVKASSLVDPDQGWKSNADLRQAYWACTSNRGQQLPLVHHGEASILNEEVGRRTVLTCHLSAHIIALAPASRNTRCAIPATSLAVISRMQRWSFILQIVLWQGWHDSTLLSWTTVAARLLRGAQR